MKKLFGFILAAVAAFGVLSCEDPQKSPQKGDNGPVRGPGFENHVDFTPVAAFPLDCSSLYAEENEMGVTIEVMEISDDNFVFELRPGAMVQSYRLDVYPLARLYNYLLDDGMMGSDEFVISEKIRTYLLDGTGSGGFEFSVDDCKDNPEDFLQKEFDWMNTQYAEAAAVAIPDCDYVIAVLSSPETSVNETNQAHLTLCHLHTTSQPLVGEPVVELDVNTGYTRFTVNHIPNSDCAGYYYLGADTDSIDAYIDAFGDVMLRDFVRTLYYTPMDVSDPEQLYYSQGGFESGVGSSMRVTTIAVAVDANLTPQEDYARYDFTLLDVPENMPEAEAEIDIIEDRVGAAYFEYDIRFSETCRTVFYRVYTKEEKESFEAMTAAQRRKELLSMVQDGSYGCHNPNFPAGSETGASGIARDCWVGSFDETKLVPGTEVYIGYFCRNAAMQYGDMRFSDAAMLDQRNFTGPQDCKVEDFVLSVKDPGRQVFTIELTYNPETVSLVHIQTLLPAHVPAGIPTEKGSSWNEWVDFVINWDSPAYSTDEFSANVMCWYSEPAGKDGFTFTGMVPGMDYLIYCCAEDFDGNISEMRFAHIRTEEVQVGPDPSMVLTFSKSKMFEDGYRVDFLIEKDVEYFLYGLCGTRQNLSDLQKAIPEATPAALADIANSGIPYETWVDGLYEWCAYGFENNGGGMNTESDTMLDWQGEETVIAVCIAVGRDESGKPVYKMHHLVCQNGKAATLEEIFGINE